VWRRASRSRASPRRTRCWRATPTFGKVVIVRWMGGPRARAPRRGGRRHAGPAGSAVPRPAPRRRPRERRRRPGLPALRRSRPEPVSPPRPRRSLLDYLSPAAAGRAPRPTGNARSRSCP
jgi:hypothetical protein